MRALAICGALSCAVFCLATTSGLSDADFTVHEWGTFTSVAGADGAPVEWNTLGCASDLPGFVQDFGYRGFKFHLSGTVRMETPVLYFYSRQDLEAKVKVSFPNGLITEWYPRADYQIFQKNRITGNLSALPQNLNGIRTYLKDQVGAIEWKSVSVRPRSTPDFPVESTPSRYYAARATDSAPVQVGDQHEKFLFYRGVANVPVPLAARIADDGRITVTNTGTDAAPSVFLFENRGGAIGYRGAGSIATSVTLERPQLDDLASQGLKSDLENALIANGLYPKEAAAMIDTWRDSWFEEGSRLIYILPESAVNAMVPLEINPAPSQITRVFVGRVELITPETKQAVRAALAEDDRHTLALYRRFLEPIEKSIGKTAIYSCQTTN